MSSRVLSSSDVSRQRSRDAGLKQAPGAPASRRESYSHDDNKSMNGADGEPSGLRRRQRNLQGSTDDLLKPTIVIKPHPSSFQMQPRMLHPLMLLPRENLPLSSLDLSSPHGTFPPSRFYESSIKILELEGRLGSNVLLACSETSKMTYAIERDGSGLYTLCKLGAWVDLDLLAQFATAVCISRLPVSQPTQPMMASAKPITTPQMHDQNKKRRLAIEEIQSIVRKRPRSQSSALLDPQGRAQPALPAEDGSDSQTASLTVEQKTERLSDPLIRETELNPISNPEPAQINEVRLQPTGEDILQNIRTQYFDMLYHSKGSLAYFAKGPLSRARAAFHLDCDSNLDMNDLIEFLKSLIMNTVMIDKKYRETIPDVVSKVKTHIEDSENGDTKSKKRRPKKPKLGKDGLYPYEEDNIRRWWTAQKPLPSSDEDNMMTPQEIKYHISCLRRRETQLQMILVLEALALEPLGRQAEQGEDSQLPGMETESTQVSKPADPAPKKRNKHNLPLLLDVHADRLCIWQSTTLDEVKALAESHSTSQGQGGQQPERTDTDPLKDFCIDVIVPFFSARLPDLCDSINRKLGGPVIKSPPKAKQHRTTKPVIASKARPGAPIKRAPSSKKNNARSLERVLSNERMRRSVSRGPADAIALLRSASIPLVPGLKRETSEPLLSMIPKGEAGSLKERPVNLFSRSTSQISENPRAKKQALIESELQDAISAIKKPNRALVGKEITEAAEKRSLTSIPLKRLKKPGRPSTFPAVQVKATPANNRFRDVLGAATLQPGWQLSPTLAVEDIDRVPSSASVVPASCAPRRITDIFGTAVVSTPMMSRNKDTPGESSSITLALGPRDEPAFPPSSPIMARRAAPVHLSIPRSMEQTLPSSPGLARLFETPVKQRAAIDTAEGLQVTPKRTRLQTAEKSFDLPGAAGANADTPGQGNKLTLYQRLGWDDDELDDI